MYCYAMLCFMLLLRYVALRYFALYDIAHFIAVCCIVAARRKGGGGGDLVLPWAHSVIIPVLQWAVDAPETL